MSMSPIRVATTWPDAGIAIAGIGMVSALGTLFIWLLVVVLREHVNGKSNATVGQTPRDAIAKGE